MLERIRHMLIKEFIQTFRDPRMRPLIFFAPLMQLLIMSYAITLDVKNVATAVYDLDRSAASRRLIDRFAGSGYFTVTARVGSDAEAREQLDRSEVQLLIRVNKGFENDVRAGRTAPVQLLLDGTDSNTAGVVLQYANRIVTAESAELLAERMRRSAGVVRPAAGIDLRSRAWFNENLDSHLYYVPGLMAIIVALITLMLTSMAVVREKELGTMEQIMVTPIRPLEFILGKTVPFALIAFGDVILVTLVGVFWFEVPVRGNLLVLLLATTVFLLTSLGVGLMISTLSRTQQQAMMSTFFFFIPAIMLSGFIFPIESMPRVVQWITLANPLRYFLVVIRGVFLKGIGLEVLWPQLAGLLALGLFTMTVATRRFKKTMA
jgi:ABC-2 type transport system permease protein